MSIDADNYQANINNYNNVNESPFTSAAGLGVHLVKKLMNHQWNTYPTQHEIPPLHPGFSQLIKIKARCIGATEENLNTLKTSSTINKLWKRFVHIIEDVDSSDEINETAIQMKLKDFIDTDPEVEGFLAPFRILPKDIRSVELQNRLDQAINEACDQIVMVRSEYQILRSKNKIEFDMAVSQLRDKLHVAHAYIKSSDLEEVLNLKDELPNEVLNMIARCLYIKHDYDDEKALLQRPEIEAIIEKIENPDFQIPEYTINYSQTVKALAADSMKLLEEIKQQYPNSYETAKTYLIKGYAYSIDE